VVRGRVRRESRRDAPKGILPVSRVNTLVSFYL
jgi:hypothetical protein